MKQSRDELSVAVAQINYTVGDIEGNTEKILSHIERARSGNADVVVFSELAILGYPPRDLVHRHEVLERQWRALDEIAAATDDDLACIVGYVDTHDIEAGHDLINAAAFCRGGEVVHRVAKRLLPTYDVFDEWRYFYPKPSQPLVSFKDVDIGISVCEDAWGLVDNDEVPDYDVDPIAELVDKGAQIVINIAASPFSIGKGDFRRRLFSDHCRRHNRPLVFANQVGANDELIFDGRSLVLDAQGKPRARLAEFDDDFQIVDIGVDGHIRPRDEQPMRPVAQSAPAQARAAVVLGIRDYVHKSNFEGVLLGLSGGIDSSLSLALATEALGKEHVHAVAMPSRFSSSHSREDARQLSQSLGVAFDEIAIEGPYQAMLDALQPHFDDQSFGVTEENLQARVRGVYLMALSNKSGSLVLACGNKSELAVGYTTLYGDMVGSLAVIGDLPKMLVYEIARLYNDEAGRFVIPERVLKKAPSAELRPDQKDEDSLPAYEVLDEILYRYIVDHESVDEIIDAGFAAVEVRDVIALVHRNEYKRWQAPPILKVTSKAFGVGWRYPLAAKYGE